MSKRRLIGPTVLTLAGCGLWTDYVFFADSPWSVIRLLSVVVRILRTIFGPLFDPDVYGWVEDITIPGLLIVAVIALVFLSIKRARTAMTVVTPDPYASLSHDKLQTAPRQNPTVVRRLAVLSFPQKWPLGGLFGEVILTFMTISVLISAAVCVVTYRYMFGFIEKTLETRAEAMTLGLADISAQHPATGTHADLTAIIWRYSWYRAVAYAYVEDPQGRIIGHMPADLPRYLARDFPRTAEQAIDGVEVEYRGKRVYEIAKRINGAGGFVHLAIWRAAGDDETRAAITPVVTAIFPLVLGIVGVFVFFVRSMNCLFSDLVQHATKVSKGEFGISLELKRADEIGDIIRSLERLRSSLHAAAIRLNPGQ